MKKSLLLQATVKMLSGVFLMMLLLFLPAGTLHYWNAWLLFGILFIPMIFMGIILLKKAPDLLAKRLNSKEQQTEQVQVIILSGFMFIGGFILAGLDFRYRWSQLPLVVVILAALVFLVGYTMLAEVMRENAYLSRAVEVQANQHVVDTGLYGVVRHPMYFATVLLFLSMPLVLGSLYAFVVFLIYPLILVKRIKNEETLLKKELLGYSEYTQKVRYRMIPFIW